jgi:hypothetical protein
MLMKFDDRQMLASIEDDADFAEWYVEDFMRHHLQNYYFEISDSGKREMTLQGREYARSFGFSDPRAQAHFVTLMWQIGPNFFTFPGFRDVVRDPRLTDLEKVDAIYKVPKEQAVLAIMNPDDRYWYPYMLGTTGGGNG